MSKFTEDQIKSFNDFQHAGVFHPFTCGSGRRTDEHHLDGEGLLVLGEEGLECPYCDYKQNWAHSFMLDDSWRNTANLMMNY
jgi:hypothetical protein